MRRRTAGREFTTSTDPRGGHAHLLACLITPLLPPAHPPRRKQVTAAQQYNFSLRGYAPLLTWAERHTAAMHAPPPGAGHQLLITNGGNHTLEVGGSFLTMLLCCRRCCWCWRCCRCCVDGSAAPAGLPALPPPLLHPRMHARRRCAAVHLALPLSAPAPLPGPLHALADDLCAVHGQGRLVSA